MWDEAVEEAIDLASREIEARNLSDGEIAEVTDRLAAAIPEALAESAENMIESLKGSASEMLRERRTGRFDYSEMIQEHWSEAFDLYEIVLRAAFELGDDFVRARVEEGDTSTVGQVVTRLQSRACRISEEILVLMKAGYGQGALARWRALHEVAVAAMFIQKHGDETAGRYLAHLHVEQMNALGDYRACHERLGYEAPSPEHASAVEQNYERVVADYGPTITSAYGWAAEAIAKNPELRGKRPTIWALEKDIGIDHYRLHYAFASHPVHPNAWGTIADPDLMPELEGQALAGPAPRGMSEPGHSALLSLTQATNAVLLLKGGPGVIVYASLLRDLTREAGEKFVAAEKSLADTGARA